MRIAAKAPVATFWLLAGEELEAVLPEAVEEAEEPLDAVEAPDEAIELEEVMVAAALASLAETRTAVAFLVPHFSFVVQACWPSAFMGLLRMHCWKVAWQMKKGRVWV